MRIFVVRHSSACVDYGIGGQEFGLRHRGFERAHFQDGAYFIRTSFRRPTSIMRDVARSNIRGFHADTPPVYSFGGHGKQSLPPADP
ncbi:hypothetical protein ACGF8B_25420 [Streptomyces sp. NPDC047917]|uniref:hypothetical protein n=1 Tax=Streptomyces sp. NPDC047917 TaxID=3365491 RepID=UPI0037103BFD